MPTRSEKIFVAVAVAAFLLPAAAASAADTLFTVPNVATMEAIGSGSAAVGHVSTVSFVANGGGGVYDWDAADTTTPDCIHRQANDSGTPVATGRWVLRVPASGLPITVCGADPTGTASATPGVQAALDAWASVTCPPGAYLWPGTANITRVGQSFIGVGNSCNVVNAQAAGEMWLQINASDVSVADMLVTGTGVGIGIGVTKRVNNISIMDVNSDGTSTGGGLLNAIGLWAADNVRVRANFVATHYGLVQQLGYNTTGLRADITAQDMYADTVELNGASTTASEDATLNVSCQASHDFPTPKTEQRCVGVTSWNDVTMNVWAERQAGDSAIHLEDIGGREDITAHLTDIQTAGGNLGWIYSIGSAKNATIKAWCHKTDSMPNWDQQFCISTGTGYYQNAMTVEAQCVGPSNRNFGCFDFSFHTGAWVKVRDSEGRNLTTFLRLYSTDHIDIQGSAVTNSTDCVMDETARHPTGSGGQDINVRNNNFACNNVNVYAGPNTNGTYGPARWNVTNNVFTAPGMVYGNLMSDGYMAGNMADPGLTYFSLNYNPAGIVVQDCLNFIRGVGKGPGTC